MPKVISISNEATGQTGTLITFSVPYIQNSIFFRNGVKMSKVTSFSLIPNEASEEYMETSPTTITLNSLTPAMSFEAFSFKT